MSRATTEPLHRFPILRTSDPEELQQLSSRLLGAVRVDLANPRDFHALINLVELEEIGLAFGKTSSALSAERLPTDFIRLQIAMKGRAIIGVGGKVTDINEHQFAVTPAGTESHMACPAGHERLHLRLNQQSLLQKLATLLGARPKGELRLAPAVPVASPYARSLYRLIEFLALQLNSEAAAFPPAVCRELEQAIQIAFLSASRHAHSDALEAQESMPAPGIVARLEGFIEANWRGAITVERLASEAGVSGRSLFRAFERSRGYSPMAFVKAVRLRRARDLLSSGAPGVTVASAAFACNFANQGHFARHYREAFGELPSRTLLRAQR